MPTTTCILIFYANQVSHLVVLYLLLKTSSKLVISISKMY